VRTVRGCEAETACRTKGSERRPRRLAHGGDVEGIPANCNAGWGRSGAKDGAARDAEARLTGEGA